MPEFTFTFDPARQGKTANGHPTGLTGAEAAGYIGLSERQYYRLTKAGVLPSYPQGRVNAAAVFEAYVRYLGGMVEKTDHETGFPVRYEAASRRH